MDELANAYYEPIFSEDFGEIKKDSDYGSITVDFFNGEVQCFLKTNETGDIDLLQKIAAVPINY